MKSLKIIFNLNILSYFWLRLFGVAQVLPLRGSRVRLLVSSVVVGRGRLIFGYNWPYSYTHRSLFVVGSSAVLFIKGKNKICAGANVSVAPGAKLEMRGVFINSNVNISCYKNIRIGSGVVISENVTIRDCDGHSIDPNKDMSSCICIEDRVWVGLNVTILKGVNIGEGAVVAAGSVVVDDIPENCLVGGVPAKIIKRNVRWA